jgi:hypothetical protein
LSIAISVPNSTLISLANLLASVVWNLELVINDHEEKLFKKHVKFLNNFDIEEKMLRYF